LQPDNTRCQMYGYSTKRSIFMNFLHDELLRINGNKDIIHWGCHLNSIDSSIKGTHKLNFSTNKDFGEFDFIIGADGVHSQVRHLLFDQEPPCHVGANILYGVIPKNIDTFEENTFHIIIGDELTTVIGRYLELNKEISTWWAAIYPDQKYNETANTAFWEKRSDVGFVKKLATELAEKDKNLVLKQLIEQTPAMNFKYSGKFLERDPSTLNHWGKNNVALLGDAIHAMMPWAGVGASMAAEDVLVLLSLFEKHKVFDNRERFKKSLADHLFSEIYEEYKQTRVNRLSYFYAMSHQLAPKGIMSKENSKLHHLDIRATYGNQHALTSVPHFAQLLNNELSSPEKIQDFFE
jgi:2-polyprenyl-6-methoxyphenol hydroxylase-like FAD-dependent oxidoreductase